MRLSPEILSRLRCPACHGPLVELACDACGRRYERVNDVPILLDDSSSSFRAELGGGIERPPGWGRYLPRLGQNLKAARNYAALASKLQGPRVLVVGGRVLGDGMEELARRPLELVETDIALGPRTQIVCDAHNLPFADDTFDGVVAQAVLEHVVDPARCVSEIRRVLKAGGLVYAETPFMQQVHAGAFDFTRFTHLGHRRLFRDFDEVDSGATCGPAMALAWSFTGLLQSFARTSRQRRVARAIGHVASFPLRYIDPLVIDRPGALDAASAVYFMGRKGSSTLSDSELPRHYRGMDHR